MAVETYSLPKKTDKYDAVILANGQYPLGIAGDILCNAGTVVCCDGAANAFIRDGGIPSIIIGDCDSLEPSVAEQFAGSIICSSDQQTNDLTKAFHYCVDEGFKNIVIVGATGRREDHTLANISLLADYSKEADVFMVTNDGVFNAIDEPSGFESYPGQQVSIFTLDPKTEVSSEGLAYPIPPGGLCSWWQATLNESTGNSFTIKTDGATLIFRAFGKKERYPIKPQL